MRLALALFLTVAVHAQPANLHGTVVDAGVGGVIVAAPIQVISDAGRCETKSDNRGEFHCQLPPGTYTITADIPHFFPYRRATVTLPAGHSFVKLRPVVTASVVAFTVDETGSHDVVTPPGPHPNIEERRVNGTGLLIRYNDMTRSDGLVIFRGPYLLLTSNLLTVYADEITCTETFQSCTARGKVRVEKGTDEEFEGTQADIDLLNHKFKLTRAATVEHSF